MENLIVSKVLFNIFILTKTLIMKKKSIQKLNLKKASISTLNAAALVAGNGTLSQIVCQSRDFCETIDFTRCRGELRCQIYPYPTDQNF